MLAACEACTTEVGTILNSDHNSGIWGQLQLQASDGAIKAHARESGAVVLPGNTVPQRNTRLRADTALEEASKTWNPRKATLVLGLQRKLVPSETARAPGKALPPIQQPWRNEITKGKRLRSGQP